MQTSYLFGSAPSVTYGGWFALNTMVFRTLGLSVCYALWFGVGAVPASIIDVLIDYSEKHDSLARGMFSVMI